MKIVLIIIIALVSIIVGLLGIILLIRFISRVLERFGIWDGTINQKVSFEYVKQAPLVKEYHLENLKSCKKCGLQPNELDWYKYISSRRSWRNLGGWGGYRSVCPNCNDYVYAIICASN